MDCYYVSGVAAKKYIGQSVGMEKFLENLADMHIERKTEMSILLSGTSNSEFNEAEFVDGFYIYQYKEER